MEKFYEAAFSPLDISIPNPTRELAAFAGICQQQVNQKGSDVELANVCLLLCARLSEFNQIREKIEADIRVYEKSPPGVLKISAAPAGQLGNQDERTLAEQERRKEYYINWIVREKWLPAVQRHRPPCIQLLERIKSLDKKSTLTLWVRIQKWFDPIIQAANQIKFRYWGKTHALTSPFSPSGVTKPVVCNRCHGTRFIVCPECAGFGRIDSGEYKPCQQCGGTGQYKKRMGSGLTRCPFCHGTGHTTESKRITCPTCQGKGQIPCPDCQPP